MEVSEKSRVPLSTVSFYWVTYPPVTFGGVLSLHTCFCWPPRNRWTWRLHSHKIHPPSGHVPGLLCRPDHAYRSRLPPSLLVYLTPVSTKIPGPPIVFLKPTIDTHYSLVTSQNSSLTLLCGLKFSKWNWRNNSHMISLLSHLRPQVNPPLSIYSLMNIHSLVRRNLISTTVISTTLYAKPYLNFYPDHPKRLRKLHSTFFFY